MKLTREIETAAGKMASAILLLPPGTAVEHYVRVHPRIRVKLMIRIEGMEEKPSWDREPRRPWLAASIWTVSNGRSGWSNLQGQYLQESPDTHDAVLMVVKKAVDFVRGNRSIFPRDRQRRPHHRHGAAS